MVAEMLHSLPAVCREKIDFQNTLFRENESLPPAWNGGDKT